MQFRVHASPKQHRQPSLFGEIIDWMLAPLLILWPISMAIEYSIAYKVANVAYDRELKDSVVVLARHMVYRDGRAMLDIRDAARQIVVADDLAETVLQVRGLKNEVIDGDPDLPGVDFTPDLEPRRVYFRDDLLRNRDVRVAYMFAQVSGLPGAVLIQVAETDDKRVMLASEISSAVLTSQFIILPLALILVWFGLSKGIAPLNELTDRVRSHRLRDLSAIDPSEAPEEVRPFIHSINDLMARLQASLKAQQRFVADAAHQMRTPLSGLKTQAELALRQANGRDIRHTVSQIVVGADQAARVINQLLALARTDSDAPTRLARFDLAPLAREVTREWVGKASDKQIDLGFETIFETSGSAFFVEGNLTLLHELLSNLIDNALRYTPEGGKVTTRLQVAEHVVLEVEDSGIGIEPGERELVFERFYRVLGTGTDGTGLGLAIVKGIALAHQAKLDLLDNPSERGTLVRITFPRSRATPVALRSAA